MEIIPTVPSGSIWTSAARFLAVLVGALALLAAAPARAQRDLGTITGTVTDSSGAVLPNATITITENATGESTKLQASSNGDFTRPALLPGTYTVKAEAAGFRPAEQQNLEVTAGSRVGVSLTLEVGGTNQSVTVTAEAPVIQSESTQLGAQLNTTQVAELPWADSAYSPILRGSRLEWCRGNPAAMPLPAVCR